MTLREEVLRSREKKESMLSKLEFLRYSGRINVCNHLYWVLSFWLWKVEERKECGFER
jgi:hypothetical protein